MTDTTDLVRRLREAEASLRQFGVTIKEWNGSLYLDAADMIERLSAPAEPVAGHTLLSCPFCGHQPEEGNMIDSTHPLDREGTLWTTGCLDNEGGCNASMLAWSRQEAIDKWNTRVAHPAAPAPDAATVKDAQRYRWLRREIDLGRLESDNPADFWALAEEDGNALDAAIDAAMKEKP